jgi:hypothetical protein
MSVRVCSAFVFFSVGSGFATGLITRPTIYKIYISRLILMATDQRALYERQKKKFPITNRVIALQ